MEMLAAPDDAGVPTASPVTDAAKGVPGSLADIDIGYHVLDKGAPWQWQ